MAFSDTSRRHCAAALAQVYPSLVTGNQDNYKRMVKSVSSAREVDGFVEGTAGFPSDMLMMLVLQ